MLTRRQVLTSSLVLPTLLIPAIARAKPSPLDLVTAERFSEMFSVVERWDNLVEYVSVSPAVWDRLLGCANPDPAGVDRFFLWGAEVRRTRLLNDNEVLLVSGESLLGSTERFYLTWDQPLKGQRLIEYRDGTTWFSSVDHRQG
jgi:hypothetical protein